MAQKTNNNRPDRGKNRKAGNSPELTAEQRKHQVAKELRISEKTKQFYDELIDGKHKTIRKAYKTINPETSDQQASVNASRLINNEKYAIYKASAVGKAKRRIVALVNSDNENIALKASQDIIDRTEGKATQKTESVNKTVEVKLDLTGVRLGAHYVPSIE